MFAGYFYEILELLEIMCVFFLESAKGSLIDTTYEFTELSEEFIHGFSMRIFFETEFVSFNSFWI
jgi:hypothetical protein